MAWKASGLRMPKRLNAQPRPMKTTNARTLEMLSSMAVLLSFARQRSFAKDPRGRLAFLFGLE